MQRFPGSEVPLACAAGVPKWDLLWNLHHSPPPVPTADPGDGVGVLGGLCCLGSHHGTGWTLLHTQSPADGFCMNGHRKYQQEPLVHPWLY